MNNDGGNDDNEKPYILWDSKKIKERLFELEKEYPDFVKLQSSQEAYGLPRTGKRGDCPFEIDDDGDGGVGCIHYFFTLQDFVLHPENSESAKYLPELLWSGCVHGNERVGPTAVMESVELLLSAASCEAMPNKLHVQRKLDEKNTNSTLLNNNELSSSWEEEIERAKKCRNNLLERHGIDDTHRKWLARLVSTRRIVVVPTANALGYFQDRREENGIDPNRDFPYDIVQSDKCMQTIAARTLNEIYRDHMFQLSFTFHGGMEVIAYEWGAPTYYGGLSPDQEAQHQIAQAYSNYGGGFETSKPYKYGTMNDLVYYVRGGMEDWAYGGSFDPDRVIQCQPKTFDGYDGAKTVYNNSTLRTFNMLVEASNKKTPLKNTLGTSKDVMNRDTTGNGHISRNIRLTLLSADLVEPYVSLLGVNNELVISDDVVPQLQSQQGSSTSCQDTKTVMLTPTKQQVTIQWTVGGALTIDETNLYYANWDEIVLSEQYDCSILQPTMKHNYTIPMQLFHKGEADNKLSGRGYFHSDGPYPSVSDSRWSNATAMGPIFQSTIDLSKIQTSDEDVSQTQKLIVIASATVDSDWKDKPTSAFTKKENKYSPDIPPQSHVVNARTNADWYHESSGKIIKGRKVWYSMPLTIVINSGGKSDPESSRDNNIIELSNRFPDVFETKNDEDQATATPPAKIIVEETNISPPTSISEIETLDSLDSTVSSNEIKTNTDENSIDNSSTRQATASPSFSDFERGEKESLSLASGLKLSTSEPEATTSKMIISLSLISVVFFIFAFALLGRKLRKRRNSRTYRHQKLVMSTNSHYQDEDYDDEDSDDDKEYGTNRRSNASIELSQIDL